MAKNYIFLQFIIIFVISSFVVQLLGIDQNGFLTYCPCMGRFGNQADHFLGAFNFAKALNRTLILPPWIEYRQGEVRSVQVPFDRYFQVEPIQRFHRVITMHDFMSRFADNVWPKHIRTSFCYMERKSLTGSTKKDCHAKEGNPFGPFWDEFSIDFVDSEFFSPLHYDVIHSPNTIEKWQEKYPAKNWPVLSFTGAPASFPVQAENVGLQKYLVWDDQLQLKAIKWIKSTLPKGAYLGIHLRNGIDWNRACEHIKDSPNLFSAAQCLGYRNEKGVATIEMCQPSKKLIFEQIKRQIKIHNEKNPKNLIKSIFIASDRDHMVNELNIAFEHLKITVFRLTENNPHLDLIILEKSNLFIGNCISSYSAFVIRSRKVRGFPSLFWACDNTLVASKTVPKTYEKDEL